MTAHRQPLRFVAEGSVRTAYRQAGSGPLLLLIHGAEADHTMFLGLMDELADRFTVVAYDQRDSGSTENGNSPYGLADLADDAARLIDGLLASSAGRRVHLFGTSFGGLVAQLVAARQAQSVDRLVLGSTWAVDRQLVDVNAAALAQIAQLRGQLPGSAEQIARWFFSQAFLAAHPEAVDLFRGTRRTPAQAARRAGMMQAAPPAPAFADITAPTLLLAGGADRLIPPAETFALARRIVHARQQELAGMPHVGVIEDPGRIAEAIRTFLLPDG